MSGYNKPPLHVQQQINLLEQRGLKISDKNAAVHFLTYTSYFRFSLYFEVFLDKKPRYKQVGLFDKDINLHNIISLYRFDAELRLLISDALAKIEVAIRTVIINHMSTTYGTFWFLEPSLFRVVDNNFCYCEMLKSLEAEVQRARKTYFVKRYFLDYDTISDILPTTALKKHLPPSWITGEVLTFGRWGDIFDNLVKDRDRKLIARYFNLQKDDMKSWLHSLYTLRNLCAHHAVVWNKSIYLKEPEKPRTHNIDELSNKAHRIDIKLLVWNKELLYTRLRIINIFLHTIDPTTTWKYRLSELINHYENQIPLENLAVKYMRFPEKWKDDPVFDL